MKAITVAILCLTSGCATCQRHPTICAVVASVAISSIAACVAVDKVRKSIESASQAGAAGQ